MPAMVLKTVLTSHQMKIFNEISENCYGSQNIHRCR